MKEDQIQNLVQKGNEMVDSITKTMQILTNQMKEFAETYNEAMFGPEMAKRIMDQFNMLKEALAPFQKFNPLLDQLKTLQPDVNMLKDMKNIMEKFQGEQIKMFETSFKQLQEISPLFAQMDKMNMALGPLQMMAPMMDQLKSWQTTLINMMNIEKK